jgi:hypothetical protein
VSSKWKTRFTNPIILSPARINLRHIFSGEVKRNANGQGRAVGYHTAFSISEGGGVRPRISEILNSSTQYQGVYQARIELLDKNTGQIFSKRSTFFQIIGIE